MIVYLAYAVALVLPTAFVSYWLGVGHAEARLRGLVRDLREHRAQLQDQVEGLAAELARAFDALPERSQAEQELKRSLYTVIQNMLVASSWPAKPYAPEPDAAPSRERSKSR